MSFSLTWLPPVLEDAGLKVAREFGWETRGLGDVGETLGVICHHTAHSPDGIQPSKDILPRGRTALRGPLAQLGLGRDGTFFVLAAGLSQHAGEGEFEGIRSGNTHFIGIEAENRGTAADVWPEVQLDAYRRGVAAILKHTRRGVEFCLGHREWARNRVENKKVDPLFDMDEFRRQVAALLNGDAPPPLLIPARDARGRPTLRRGDTGPRVLELQALLGMEERGPFGPHTEALVRAFQRGKGLVPDGIVGPKTWVALGPNS